MKNYILLVDKDENTLAVLVTALKHFYGGKIHQALSNEEAIKVVERNGEPEVILIDFQILTDIEHDLMQHLFQQKFFVPIIATSDDPQHQNLVNSYPMVSALLDKPVSAKAFSYIIKGVVTSPLVSPSHVPVKFTTLLTLPVAGCDAYIKLAQDNYIKVLNKGDSFTDADAANLKAKGFKELHVLASDCFSLLEEVEAALEKIPTAPGTAPDAGQTVMAIDALEEMQTLAKALGWSPELLEKTKKAVNKALKVLSKNQEILDILNQKLGDVNSPYTRHVGLLCYLTCALGSYFDWVGDSGKEKLVLVSMLHDLAVDEAIYHDINAWNAKASDFKDKAPEVVRYRMHTIEAAKKLHGVAVLPADVEQIILQHHEKADGRGFPRGISAARISHLATLFILIEDLVDCLSEDRTVDQGIEDFVIKGKEAYDNGNFKKFFEVIIRHISKKFPAA